MNKLIEKYKTTALILMMIASISFLIINLIYWFLLILEAGESPLISAVIISIFFGLIPFAITLVTYYFPPFGSIITIIISIIMFTYWIIAFVSNSIQTNPVLVYGGLPLTIIFLAGGVFYLIYSIRLGKAG